MNARQKKKWVKKQNAKLREEIFGSGYLVSFSGPLLVTDGFGFNTLTPEVIDNAFQQIYDAEYGKPQENPT